MTDPRVLSSLRRGLALLVLSFVLPLGCAPSPEPPAPAAPPPAPPPLPDGVPRPRLSGNVPLAVEGLDSLPPDATPEQARPFFDTFSWQMFVALSWPAGAQRGTAKDPDDPQVFRAAADGAQPVAWGTYKADFELFDQGDNRPTAWEDPAIPVDPCGSGSADTKTFVRVTKGDNLVEIGNQAFSYPLIDQSLNYAVYEVRFNEWQYDFVRGEDGDESTWLYLAKNLAALEDSDGGVQMPASAPPDTQGAIMLKAAWKELDPDKDDASRFYAVASQVYDPATQTCSPATVGLVGFHIVQKLQEFPEWIWATFEQVDNVPDGVPEPGRTYSFNNGTNDPETVGGYAERPPSMAPQLQPKGDRVAVQVTRFNPIPDSTEGINAAWRSLLSGTVWAHYELVITQWPSDPGTFLLMEDGGVYPRDAGGAFPANGATNTVAETYFQSEQDAAGAGGNSCMSCHYVAGQADFSWTLMRGAH